jgi:hypothetical protein
MSIAMILMVVRHWKTRRNFLPPPPSQTTSNEASTTKKTYTTKEEVVQAGDEVTDKAQANTDHRKKDCPIYLEAKSQMRFHACLHPRKSITQPPP